MSNTENTSEFLRHIPCENCGSSDANSLYTDGHQFCFACQHHVKGDGEGYQAPAREPAPSDLLRNGEARALLKRGIDEETCKKFKYLTGNDANGKPVQIATYCGPAGQPVAQKLRYPDKSFVILGDAKAMTLYGQHLWKGGGKKLIITEGEIDCLSVSKVQGNKWPVVSLPNGAQSAKKAIQKNIEFVCTFDEVVLMFDADEPGQAAALEVADILPPGKAFIATIDGFKDANEALQAGKADLIINAIWNAKPHRPDGLVTIADLRDELMKPVEIGLPYWDERVTKVTYGRRYGEIVGIGAGTGIGKTDWIAQQVAYDVIELRQKVGLVFLEQKPKETCQRLAGKIDGCQYHVPDSGADPEQMMKTLDSISDLVTMYDSFGQTDWEVVANKIRFMAQALGTRLFYVDHLTAMADTADEKGSLEQIMKELAGLANELNVWILFVSHLTTPEGKPHEEGGHVSIRHFKGSRAIGFWSFFMFGLERNQQAEDIEERSTTTFRILKDRYTGQATGNTFLLGYDPATGRSVPKAKQDLAPSPGEYGF